MSEQKVVITGQGLVTSLGNCVAENWENVLSKKTGIRYDPKAGHPHNFCFSGCVRQLKIPDAILQEFFKQVKFLNRGSVLGLLAALEAMSQCQKDPLTVSPGRRALYIGSGDCTKMGCDFLYPAIRKATDGKLGHLDSRQLNASCLNEVNPFFLLETMHNNLFSFLSAFFQLKGPNTCLASFSPSGMQALELAFRSIKEGSAEFALAVGCGSWITEIPLYELDGLGLISRCKDQIESFKPFDRRRDGFIPGEGGAAIVLEDMQSAKRRGAKIFASIEGSANCVDFSTRGPGVSTESGRRSIEMALQEASCRTDELAFIIPHGSATPKGDRSELASVKAILGAMASRVPLSGLKPYTGHLGAASDIAEVVFGIKAIEQGIVPATLNFKKSEGMFSSLKISGDHQSHEKNHFLSVSYGMGGQACAVVVKSNRAASERGLTCQ